MEPLILHWQRFLATTDGRDKLYRLVQYAAKTVRGVLAGREADGTLAVALTKAAILEACMLDSRKVLRLARGVNIVAKRLRQRNGTVSYSRVDWARELPAALEALGDAGLFGFFAADHLAWLYRSKLWEESGKRDGVASGGAYWGIQAGRFYLLASVALLVQQLVRGSALLRMTLLAMLRRLQQRKSVGATSNAATTAATASRSPAVSVEARGWLATTLRYACDVLIGLNMSRPGKYSQTYVGIAGMISSLVQIAQLWPAVAPAPTPTRAPSAAAAA